MRSRFYVDEEFPKLRGRFGFAPEGLRLVIAKSALRRAGGCDFLGCYARDSRTIILPRRAGTRRRLITLLHEIAHAIQHREGRSSSDCGSYYENEDEASNWAVYQYGRIYARRLGPPPADALSIATAEAHEAAWPGLAAALACVPSGV